jgi:hypothetical protein
MSFMPTAASLASTGTEVVRELPIPAWSYGALALACFMLLLGVLWSFRNTAAKYDTPIRVTHGGPGDTRRPDGTSEPGAHH